MVFVLPEVSNGYPDATTMDWPILPTPDSSTACLPKSVRESYETSSSTANTGHTPHTADSCR